MRNHLKKTLSTALAVAILGYAVMLTASFAKGPYRYHEQENAFDGPPLGHPEKSLVWNAPSLEHGQQTIASDHSADEHSAFEWGLEPRRLSPTHCGDSAVVQVVLDMPEPLGPSDISAIDMIKRKLGINAFRGSIFDGPDAPSAQLLKQEAPANFHAFDCVLGELECDHEPPAACQVRAACDAATVRAAASKSVAFDDACTVDHQSCPSQAACASVAGCEDEEEVSEDYAYPRTNVGIARVSRSSNPVEVLRDCSPGLDEMANRLEELDLYAEADAIREAAQRLRVKARMLKHGELGTVRLEAPRWSGRPVAYDYDSGNDRGDERSKKRSAYGYEVHDE